MPGPTPCGRLCGRAVLCPSPSAHKYLILLVGARGFEPRTPCAQGRCATRLRYAPTSYIPDFKLLSYPLQVACTIPRVKTVPEAQGRPNRAKTTGHVFRRLDDLKGVLLPQIE
jgi:hypothetical protein